MTVTRTVRSPSGLNLAAYDFGGDGPPLLLIHATGFHARAFGPLVERLRDRFRCFGFDLRGHGASDAPADHDFDWLHFAADARAVCESFGLERPYGFGHSCGGAVLLLSDEQHEASWRALYTYEPIVPPTGWFAERGLAASDNPMASTALRRRTSFPDRQSAYDNYRAKPPLNALAPEALRSYVEHGFVDQPDATVTLACRPESEAATFMAAASCRVWDDLEAVRCPVVVAYGEKSGTFNPAHHQTLADRIPHGAFAEMPGLGHFGPLEAPAVVAGAVVTAFARDGLI